MKVRMKTIVAGPNISAHPEQILEVGVNLSEKQAKAFVKAGYAEYCDSQKVIESPGESPILDFGKYEGKALEEVPGSYLEYLGRLSTDADLKSAAKAEIKRRKNEENEMEGKPESTSIENRETTSKTDDRGKRKNKPRKSPPVKTPDSDS